MSNCRNEQQHDHSQCELRESIDYSLFQYIDTQKVVCLNESTKDSAQFLFKSWDNRFDLEKVIQLECSIV